MLRIAVTPAAVAAQCSNSPAGFFSDDMDTGNPDSTGFPGFTCKKPKTRSVSLKIVMTIKLAGEWLFVSIKSLGTGLVKIKSLS